MPDNIKELEDQSFDTEAAIADISADLFGQGGESVDGGAGGTDAGAAEDPGKPSPVEPTSPQQPAEAPADPNAPAPEDNSAAVQEAGGPKTWTKEALAEWATVPPRVQAEILKREDDFLKGISMYKEKATLGDAYDKVVEPFRPILQAENIDPVQLFSAFASNHYVLSRGTEAQKLELATQMIQGYGIDFQKLVNHFGDKLLAPPPDPRIQQLESQIQELTRDRQTRQQQETAALEQRLTKEIEDFASDPANPFFNELVADIQKLFAAGQAETLREAYDKAVYLNPATREKEIERLAAERARTQSTAEQERQQKIARSTAADLALDPKSKNGTVPIGSIDDTLAETLARIQSRA